MINLMYFSKVSDILHNLVYRLAGSEYKELVTISFGWKQIVGKIIAQRSSVYKLEKNVLFITVTNNVWMQELILNKTRIINDIYKNFRIKLSDIVFFTSENNKSIFS